MNVTFCETMHYINTFCEKVHFLNIIHVTLYCYLTEIYTEKRLIRCDENR